MTQNTILPSGNSAGTSSDVLVVAGAFATIGLFTAANGVINPGLKVEVMQDTPGGDNPVATLSADNRTTVISGPGTFRVQRPQFTGDAVGVFSED